LRQATDEYLSLCRRHGLIRSPEPLNYEQILKAAPAGGALVLPVVTETAAFVFIVAAAVAEAAVIYLPNLDGRALVRHLNEGWAKAYYSTVHGPGFNRRSPAYPRWNEQIGETQAWLWQVLLGPVDAHLRDEAGLSPMPRLSCCRRGSWVSYRCRRRGLERMGAISMSIGR
jgi:hypothetical protein